MKSSWRVLLVMVCAAGLAASGETPKKAPSGPSALDKPTFEAYVRHLFVWGKNITVTVSDPQPSMDLPGFYSVSVRGSNGQASQDESFLISKDGRKILRAMVFDVRDNPFKEDLDKLKTKSQSQPSLGTEGAPVVLVEFTDFECPFCKQEASMLRQNLVSAYPKEVHLYFKDFPLPAIHPWAKTAAIAGRCVYRQSEAAFWNYHDWVYEHQTEITADNFKDKLLDFAKDKGIDTMLLGSCLDTRATEAEVDRSMAEGAGLRITGTPTMFINGRRIEGQLPWPNLKDIIDYEIEYQKTAKNAGEDCDCGVKLPTPAGKLGASR